MSSTPVSNDTRTTASNTASTARTTQSEPTFYTPEKPGASNYVPIHSLLVYDIQFKGDTNDLAEIRRFRIKAGKLYDYSSGEKVQIEGNRYAWFYFSHRDDLLKLDQKKWFAKDGSGLPLLGPIHIPGGKNVKLEIDIWEQQDWVIVYGSLVDGARADAVKMADWREDYAIGQLWPLSKGGYGFFPYGSYREKDRQESWKGSAPIDLVHFGEPNGDPMWVGTLSACASNKAKLLLVHKFGSRGNLYAGSFNEIEPTGHNLELSGYHVYDQRLVNRLLKLPESGQKKADVDALPAPKPRCLLPGDMCWQDQGQTNNCGAFSFSTAMNYWMPYTNNPDKQDGAFYAKPGNVDDTINGARTPRDIVNAAKKFRMNVRDNNAEDLDKERALKLVKLWIQAGVPVLILVEEYYNVWSLHWKTLVGYDGERFFMNNSGADREVILSERTPGVEYEKAPIGNDVDSESGFWEKWKSAGGGLVDLITSVDQCTFIPIYPQDRLFAGEIAR